MPPKMDVFVLGEPAELAYEFAEPKWPMTLCVIPTGVATVSEFARSPWADRILEGDANFAAIVASSDRESLQHAFCMAFTLASDPDEASAAHLMIERIDAGLLVDPTSSLLARRDFRILLAPRALHGSAVFRRSKFKRNGPLRPISQPIWDWVLRAACNGEEINATPVPDDRKSAVCR